MPTANNFSSLSETSRTGGNELLLLHAIGYNSRYAHLDRYADVISRGKPRNRRGFSFLDQELHKNKIIAYSGNTGIGPGGGIQRPHVHFEIRWYDRANQSQTKESLDPFTLGIDTEKPMDNYLGKRFARPVYWDTKTAIPLTAKNKKKYLQRSLDTLVKRIQESDLDQITKEEILKRQNKPEELRDYLGMRVLQKKQGDDGKPHYEFMPGSSMYGLMLEFYGRTSKEGMIAMLPFIFPPLKSVYHKANPGIQL